MKPITILKPVILLLFIFFSNQLFAQTELKNAWQAFFENNRDEARSLFLKAADQKQSAGDALLGLSLLAQLDKPSAESFDYFKKFYAQSNDPQPYIYALWITSSINEAFGKKTPEQMAFFRELTQKKDYDGTIAAIAYSMLGNHFNSGKKTELANKEYANIGSIDNWAISGEFENISTSGFDKQYETLSHPEDKSSFTNKNGVNVAWHSVPYLRHDKWFDFTYYANADDAILFAQTFINSNSDQEAQLRIGVSGSVKVWANDKLILSEAEERNNDLDSYIQSIKLHKGYNRVVVQIGESYAERSNFLVRITDKNGHILPGITSTASYHPYTKENNYVSQKSEQFAVAYFEQKVRTNPDDYLSKLLLAQTYLELDRTFEAREIIEPLVKKYPNSTYLNTLLLNVFSKTKNRTGEETVKETIKMADPESLIGLNLKYNELFDQKEYDKAAGINAKIEQLYPFDQELIYGHKLDLADANKNQDDFVKITEEAYAKLPDDKTFMTDKYLVEENLRKDLPKAIETLKNYVDNNEDYSAAKDLADMYFSSGNAAAGFKVYQDQIASDSIGIRIYSDLAEQYYKQQNYDKAAQYYLSCIKISPTTGDYYTSLGQVYEMAGQKPKAIQYYQKGLQLNPTDYESIKSLRKLQNKKDVFDYFETPDVDAIIKNAPKASDYPDDNYVVLDQEVQKVVYENGGSEDRHYTIAKIFNQKGIEAWKEYSVNYNNDQNLLIETAEVIKPNGTKVPAERNENNLVFTNLEIGDIININYKISNYFKGSLSSHFWDSFYFSMGCPSVNLKYSLLIGKNKKFSYKFSGQNIDPVKKDDNEFDLYVWKSSNTKSINVEDKMPASADIANTFYLTSIPDWKFISDWYNDIASAKARTNYEVKTVVNQLFDTQSHLTEMQKIEKIYDYIISNITYSSVSFRQSGIVPQNPADVINTRIGDCKDVATLFVTMCKEAGIKAQLVLVKTRNFGLNSMLLPTIDFNHCMAKVNLDNKDYYFELTSKYLPFTSIYTQYLNSSILDIGDTGSKPAIKYLNPGTRKQNNVNISVNIAFRDKDLLVTQTGNRTQADAAIYRAAFGDLSVNDRMKKFKEIISSQYPDNELSELSMDNLNKVSADTVYIKLKYEIRNATKEIAGLNIFSLPWTDKLLPAYFNITTPRYSGIDISQMFAMDNETETITLTLPDNKKIVEDPTPIVLTNDFIDYSIIPQTKDGKLTLTRTIKLKKAFIPVEKAQEFNAFFKKIVEADSRELAMK